RAAGRRRDRLLRRLMDLHGPLFGDSEVAAHFAARARLQAMLDFEVALAEAEAGLGVVPAGCVEAIRAAARAEHYDLAAIAAAAAPSGNVAIPPLAHLTRRVAAVDGEAARYVHRGATSQDVLDTALVLQLRAAVPVVIRHLDRAAAAAAAHAERH